MNEQLLQFHLQFQYFNKTHLQLQMEMLNCNKPGRLNTNQGPWFSEAKLNWKHYMDREYENMYYLCGMLISIRWCHYLTFCMLVWMNDVHWRHKNIYPTLSCNNLFPKYAAAYQQNAIKNFVACEEHLPCFQKWVGFWKERLIAERSGAQSKLVLIFAAGNNHGRSFLVVCCKEFWKKVNADPLNKMAKSVPVNVLTKPNHKSTRGIIVGHTLYEWKFQRRLSKALQREYNFYPTKYKLQQIKKSPDFFTYGPANFQLFRMPHCSLDLDLTFVFTRSWNRTITQLKNCLIWRHDYCLSLSFDEQQIMKEKNLGEAMIAQYHYKYWAPVLLHMWMYHKNSMQKL